MKYEKLILSLFMKQRSSTPSLISYYYDLIFCEIKVQFRYYHIYCIILSLLNEISIKTERNL